MRPQLPAPVPLHHNEIAIPKAPKPTPKTKTQTKNKRRSQSPFEIEETVPSKHATRATTKYNMPRNKLSNVDKTEQSGKGIIVSYLSLCLSLICLSLIIFM